MRSAVTDDAGPGAAFTVSLPADDAGIFPTAYTLKHGNAGTQYSLRSWVLEAGRGGTDRNNVAETDWVLLSEHKGDGSLDCGFAHHTWPLAGHRLGAGNAVCGNSDVCFVGHCSISPAFHRRDTAPPAVMCPHYLHVCTCALARAT